MTLSSIRTLVLPALLLFALPVFALWFSRHAEQRYDENFLTNVLGQVDADRSISADEREQARAFYRAYPPSVVCGSADPELESYRTRLDELCGDYAQFSYCRLTARAAIGVGAFAVVFALLSALLAFVSRAAQYASLLLGWNVLKMVGAVETLLQGALLVWLSFWMTAVWAERYYVKLIAVMGMLALVAAYAVIRAIFRRPEGGVDVEGELVTRADAPELWARIDRMCKDLVTSAPDHLVVGIDDNFFVTESEVRVAGQRIAGRVLYLSLSLLRTMERREADAVLAHELAHLLGGDTGHSKKLAPLRSRFVHYMTALHSAGITRPIYYFMRAYYAVFELSVARSQRHAEFAADAIAARVTSPRDIARSLIKVGAYASFRGRVEDSLFEHDESHTQMGIAARVGSGFASYVRTDRLHLDLVGSVTPHPFDSHPPLHARIVKVGSEIVPDGYAAVLLEPVQSSWASAIAAAPEIEQRLWSVYEERFAKAHDLALAYRYEPADDDERAHVEKYFPPLAFSGKGGLSVQLDYAGIQCSEWETRLEFGQIKAASLAERLFKKYLDLKLKEGGMFKSTRSVCLSKLDQRDAVVEAFNRYYGRHQAMVAHRAETSA